MPLSQEKLEDEKSISFFKKERTPFKGKLIEGGGDVENLFRFSNYSVTIFLFLSPLSILFAFTRGARDFTNWSITLKNSNLDIGKLTWTFFAYF